MSHQANRQFQMAGNSGGQYNDTTFTKIFVGGLAWETQRDTMRRYFEQFGEILEAVVIADKNTGRSKGYGFVTFKDPESAMRACQNPSPVIDGRRANCNLASLGAHKPRPTTPQHGQGRFRAGHGSMAPPAYQSSTSTYFHQPTAQYPFPYSPYGYAGYSQDSVHPMSYYGIYGGQQFSPYLTTSGHNFYPFYGQYAQSGQAQAQAQAHHHHGFNVQYPHLVHYNPYLTQQHYGSTGILSLPSSMPITTTTNVTGPAATNPGPTGTGPATSQGPSSEQNSSSS